MSSERLTIKHIQPESDSESGQGTTEYALILSFVAVAVVTAAMLFGANLASYLGWIAAQA